MPRNSVDENVSVIKYQSIDITGTGAQELITAVTSAKLRVLAMFIACHTTTTINIQDDTATPVELIGGTRQIKMDPAGSAGMQSFTLPYNEAGWFETSAGKALDANMTGVSGAIAGCITYVEVIP